MQRLLILVAVVGLLGVGLLGAMLVRKANQAKRLADQRAEGLRLVTEARDELEQGLLRSAEERYAEALEPLQAYVSRRKDDAEALVAYAECRLREPLPNGKHIAAAINAATLASQVAPQDPAPLEFFISLYSQVVDGDPRSPSGTRLIYKTELLDACDKLLAIKPDSSKALNARVRPLVEFGRLEEARASAEACIAAAPDDFDRYQHMQRVIRAELEESGDRDAVPGAIESFYRSPEIAERFADRPLYHATVAAWSGTTAKTASAPAAERDGLLRALASARTAAALPPRHPAESPERNRAVALEITQLLRRIGETLDDESIIAEADAAVDRYLDEGLGDAYAAMESRRAWWLLRDDRAAELADRIAPDAADAGARGWRAFLGAWIGNGPGAELADADEEDSETAFWNAAIRALTRIDEGASPVQILEGLRDAELLATELDMAAGLRDHASLLAMVRARAYRTGGQALSAIEVLRRATGRTDLRQRLRLVGLLADLYALQGETRTTESLLAELQSQGADLSGLKRTVNRYFELRLRDTSTQMAATEARRQLEKIQRSLAENPENPGLIATHARLLLLAGRRTEGLAEARRLLEFAGDRTVSSLEELSRLVAATDPTLAGELLGLAPAGADAPVMITGARAELALQTDGPDAALAVLRDAGAERADAPLALVGERARFLDRNALPGAADAMRGLSDRFPDSALAQSTVLDSQAVWTDSDAGTVRTAIERLRKATGEDAIEWRRYTARADLAALDGLSDDERAQQLARITRELTDLEQRLPNDPVVRRLLAVAYDLAGDPDRAVRSMTEAARRDASAYPELIRYLDERGRRDDAAVALDAFASVPGETLTAPQRRIRAALLEGAGQAARALEDRRVLAHAGSLTDTAALGFTLARTGDAPGAREVVDQLRDRSEPDATRDAARLLCAIGAIDEAMNLYLDQRRGPDGETGATLDLARILIDAGALDRAEALLAPLTEANPEDSAEGEILARAVIMRTYTLLMTGRVADASAMLEATDTEVDTTVTVLRGLLVPGAGAGAPGRIPVTLATGLATASLSGNAIDDEVGAIIRENTSLDPTDASARITEALGELCSDPARRASDLAWNLWSMLAAETDPASVAGILEKAVEALPRAAWAAGQLAEVRLAEGDLDGASRAVQMFAQRDPGNAWAADRLRARIAMAERDAETALTWLRPHADRVETGPAGFADVERYVAALVITGETERAEAVARARASSDPAWAGLYLAGVSSLPGREIERRRAWLEAYDTVAGDRADTWRAARAWTDLAQNTSDPSDITRALELLESVDPERGGSELEMRLVWIESIAGRKDAAGSRIERLIAAYPDQALILNNCAYTMTTDLGRASDAVPLARRAVDLVVAAGDPDGIVAAFYHTLGTAQRLSGATDDAIASLEAGLERDGSNPDLLIELAEIRVERGERDEARRLIDRLQSPENLPPESRQRAEKVIEAVG